MSLISDLKAKLQKIAEELDPHDPGRAARIREATDQIPDGGTGAGVQPDDVPPGGPGT